jgi:hypothetical protein
MQKLVGLISRLCYHSRIYVFSNKLPTCNIVTPYEIWINLWRVTTETEFGATSWSLICEINPLTPELNPSVQRCLTRFLLGILLLEPCISFIYMREKPTNAIYLFSLLIMYVSSYMFRLYIAIFRERS